ncbi:hypothetical protein EI94DRAFT_1898550 [Lactarius quietus]|nr:hypothetical protein EI94DRAFT_1898550 [Lactarius quietus]
MAGRSEPQCQETWALCEKNGDMSSERGEVVFPSLRSVGQERKRSREMGSGRHQQVPALELEVNRDDVMRSHGCKQAFVPVPTLDEVQNQWIYTANMLHALCPNLLLGAVGRRTEMFRSRSDHSSSFGREGGVCELRVTAPYCSKSSVVEPPAAKLSEALAPLWVPPHILRKSSDACGKETFAFFRRT